MNHRYLDKAALDVGGRVMCILSLDDDDDGGGSCVIVFLSGPHKIFLSLQLQVQPTT